MLSLLDNQIVAVSESNLMTRARFRLSRWSGLVLAAKLIRT
jgi:hypothetical protein